MSVRLILRLFGPLLLAAALLAGTPHRLAAEAPFAFATTPGKLPKTVVPSRYTLHLRPDLNQSTTKGSVTIAIQVLQPITEIVLNALDLEITRATLRLAGANEISLESVADTAQQTLTLKLPKKIPPGKYRLGLAFSGRIGEQMQGLFQVKYPAPSGPKLMLATQMEPTDARRMFPCWDEPVFRAVFDLTVVLPERFQAVSNLPIATETPLADGLQEVRFAPTPPMASYLVVLVAGEFEELRDQADGVQIRVLTTEGRREQGRYALTAAKELLAYYNRYFGLKYPLPKLDLIAVPGGFDGAMENWGAITCDEGTLLYDPRSSSPQTRRDIFVVIAHEMAHQWFGDLVTMAWWDNLWLNEGFASWMETKATDHFNPAWQMWLSANAEKSTVMTSDARNTTHPIQQPIQNESEANAAFDSITYQKGAALLRMLELYLGPDQFRRGLHRYLADHRLSNATTADLWAALEKVSGKPIATVAPAWTEQPGLPVVRVRTEPSHAQQLLVLEQERFTVQDPNATPLSWKIPVAWCDAAHPQAARCVLLESNSLALPLPDGPTLLKVNTGDAGYYRVWYAPPLFDRLRRQVSSLPAADRLNLLDDEWALVEANHASVADFFALAEELHHDPTYAIQDKILSTLTFLDDLAQGSPGHAAFQQCARALLQPQFLRLGWAARPREPESDALLRGRNLWGLACFGDPAVIAEAKARFAEASTRPGSLPSDLRPAVLRIVGRYCDRHIYDQLHEMAAHAAGTEERQLLYGALAEALDPVLARQTLALALSELSSPQEAAALVVKVAANGGHKTLAWEFARQHQDELLAHVDAFSRSGFAPSLLGTFSDLFHAAEMEAYVAANTPADAVARAREAAQSIRFKAALKQRELPVLATWVAQHTPPADTGK